MWRRGTSGNPRGRPRSERTIAAALEAKLDKQAFAQKLIDLAMGGEGIEPVTQLGAARLILNYLDGMPVTHIERTGTPSHVTYEVTFIDRQLKIEERDGRQDQARITAASCGTTEDH
jgi:hypothetical protein